MTRRGNPSKPTRGRLTRPALLRVLVALAVMLFAVLPHATLAASAFHAAASPTATPARSGMGGEHDAHRAEAAVPCHDAGKAPDQPGPAKPSCCIFGCGLLAQSPSDLIATTAASWRHLAADPALAVAESEPEPAERPPRRAVSAD